MPLHFFLAAVFGKAAAGAVAKGLAAKAAGAGAKGLVGHHAHHKLAWKVTEKVAENVAESGVRAAFAKKRKKDAKR